MAQPKFYKKNQAWGIGGTLGFSLLSLGQIVSLIGSGMTCFAQSVWIYTDMGGSIVNLSLLAAAAQLPGLLVSPFAGVLVDRWDRRWVMVICNAIAMLATLVLQLLIVTHTFQIWHIFAITVVLSIVNHFQWPAFFATIPLVVPKRNLGSANGMVQVARALGMVAAPFMAGILVTLFQIQGVILFDMVSYSIAFVTLLIVRIPSPPLYTASKTVEFSFKHDLVYGWKYLMERPGLVRLVTLFAVSSFIMGIVSVMLLPMALSTVSAAEYGSIASIGGICVLVSGIAVSIWGVPKHRIRTVLVLMVVQGVALMLGGLQPSVILWIAASAIFFFAAPISDSCSEVIWQSKTAPHVQGRVLAATWMISVAAAQLGYLVSGPLAQYIFEPLMSKNGLFAGSVGSLIGTGPGRGIGLIFIILGALFIGSAIMGYFSRRLRNLEVELPDEIDSVSITPNVTTRMIGAMVVRE